MTHPNLRRLSAVVVALIAVAAPSSAQADTTAVIRDCQDGRINGSFSQREFSDALRNIPTDVDEYTDCRDVIRRAQLGAAGGPGGGGGAGGAGTGQAAAGPNTGKSAAQILAEASPAEQASVRAAIADEGTAPVVIGGQSVSPDTTGLSPAGAANVLPTPLIVVLILLGAALLAGGAQTLRSHVIARRTPVA